MLLIKLAAKELLTVQVKNEKVDQETTDYHKKLMANKCKEYFA
ncbi:hypothetical protein [Alteribacillus bidgolensis]|nr:hypothetical protein [Alteribacillus bidgolensis]